MIKNRAKKIVLIATMAATIEAGKLALASLPNIEVVTLLCALYGYEFGLLGIFASLIFVFLEIPIYGLQTWVISYFIYWPLVSLVFFIIGKKKISNRFFLTMISVFLTIFFGVLTSAVDTGLFMGSITWKKFSVMYIKGLSFYAIQIVCNLFLFITSFNILQKFLDQKIKPIFYESSVEKQLE